MPILTLLDLQWLGCITGAAGSLLLALNTRHSGWGFVLFLISNGFWVLYGVQTHAPGLITNQIFFTATSTLGIYRWLILNPKTAAATSSNQTAPQGGASEARSEA